MFTPVGNPQNLYLASAFLFPQDFLDAYASPYSPFSDFAGCGSLHASSASVDIASQPVEEQPEPKKLAVYLALLWSVWDAYPT